MSTSPRCRVLVVEDDKAFAAGLIRLFESLGWEAMSVGTVAEALASLMVAPLASAPDCLILDLNLPDGHGTRVLEHVRLHRLPVKVAVMSGTSDAALLAEARDLRPDAVFRKPPDWGKFVAWLKAESLPFSGVRQCGADEQLPL